MGRHDVIVVGGGLSGWVAAALLAKGGKRVLLVERARTFGGRAATAAKGGVHLKKRDSPDSQQVRPPPAVE